MKFLKSIYALYLMLVSLNTFRPRKEFKNKSVAIVGAANSTFKEKNGKFIDAHDVVIRVNRAAVIWEEGKKEYLGSKFTYLFHSFYENNFSGGGPIDWEHFKSLGIKKLVNTNCSFKGITTHFNYYKRHFSTEKTYLLSFKTYKKLTKELNGYIPTVGYAALFAALQVPCKSIFITGFTFFKTPYAQGYRKELETMEANRKHIEFQGIHNPDLEFECFKKALKNSPCKNVSFDATLENLLKQD